MAEVHSSPMALGKRSTAEITETDLFPAIMKRRRPFELVEEELSGLGFDDPSEEKYEAGQVRRMPQADGFGKRHRMVTAQDDSMDAPVYSQRYMEFIQDQHARELENTREQCEKALTEQRDAVQSEQQALLATVQNLQAELERATAENRILKRGVNIQHTKTEELQAEVNRLNDALVNAADYIARAERTNESLRIQLAMVNHPSSMMNFQPPPDVF